jgi:hypothetical protein
VVYFRLYFGLQIVRKESMECLSENWKQTIGIVTYLRRQRVNAMYVDRKLLLRCTQACLSTRHDFVPYIFEHDGRFDAYSLCSPYQLSAQYGAIDKTDCRAVARLRETYRLDYRCSERPSW